MKKLLTAAFAMALTLVAFGRQTASVKGGLDGTEPALWHGLGSASWRVEKGEIVGTVGASGGVGWLVADRGYEELAVKFSFRCTGGCQTGVLLGMMKAGANTAGLYVSLADADLTAYDMTVDTQGNEIERRQFETPSRGAAPPQAGRGGLTAPVGHPMSMPAPRASVTADGWNQVEMRTYIPVNGMSTALEVIVNGMRVDTGYPAAKTSPITGDRIAAHPPIGRFGPLALRVSGNAGAEVRFKDVSILNYADIVPAVDKFSNRFRVQQVTPYFYGDGSCVGDLNRDGALDVVGGLMAWLGPDFKRARALDVVVPLPVTDYGATISCEVADFTGDGWPDVLEKAFPGGSAIYLYVNPQKEIRRWARYEVLAPTGPTENVEMIDIDRDGKPEFLSGGDGAAMYYAKPDPADPTKPWVKHYLTERANYGPHSIGVGDVNGDGRIDVLRSWGWWEQPADITQVPWPYHQEVFGRPGPRSGGGAQMQVYDVNGDGLNDVVTSLEAHGYGLAWFEQKRDKAGKSSFVQHMIMDRDPAQSGGVAFTEMHGLTLGDVDGDGLKDIITGKHRDHNFGGLHYSYSWADEDNADVFYWFKLFRDPKAPGGSRYEPHLIHNNSGGGRQPIAVDMNGDGVLDIVNSGRFGTMIFFGKKGAVE